MANSLEIKLGVTTFSVPVKGTIVQVKTALRRYAASKNIPLTDRTDTEVVEDILNSFVALVREASSNVQREELLAAQRASLEAQIVSDNSL